MGSWTTATAEKPIRNRPPTPGAKGNRDSGSNGKSILNR